MTGQESATLAVVPAAAAPLLSNLPFLNLAFILAVAGSSLSANSAAHFDPPLHVPCAFNLAGPQGRRRRQRAPVRHGRHRPRPPHRGPVPHDLPGRAAGAGVRRRFEGSRRCETPRDAMRRSTRLGRPAMQGAGCSCRTAAPKAGAAAGGGQSFACDPLPLQQRRLLLSS